MKKEMFRLSLSLFIIAVLGSCSSTKNVTKNQVGKVNDRSIVILYENDVHCGIDGYTKLAGLRDAIAAADTAYVAVVSNGDYLQGGPAGAISHGMFIADIIRSVGYDAITLGNHEFDYGVPRMKEVMANVGAPVVCANFFEMNTDVPYYSPYIIKQFGNKRIAFVGATTPETMNSEGYSFYDEAGNQLYDLREKTFYNVLQQAVDKARSEGADYVVILSHVGEDPFDMNIDSHQMIAATKGVNVVLDGHTHSTIPADKVNNLEGKAVPISQTGTQFANIGKLLITRDGRFTTTLIPAAEISYQSERVNEAVKNVDAQLKEVTSRVVCTSEFPLKVYDEKGVRLVRRLETGSGDLVTDAYRHAMQAEIAFQNGGGIRNDLPAGNITYGDIVSLDPFDNTMCKIEATGAQILEMLTKCTRLVPQEDGRQPQCTGIKYTIHSASHTISDVAVLQADGTYKPLDPAATYTLAVSSYYKGGGYYDIFKDCRVLRETGTITRDVLSEYMEKVLNGKVPQAYAQPQGRITIVDD